MQLLQSTTNPLDDAGLTIRSQEVPGQGTSSQDALGLAGVQMEAGLCSGRLGDANNAAAAAPLIKVNMISGLTVVLTV